MLVASLIPPLEGAQGEDIPPIYSETVKKFFRKGISIGMAHII